MARATVQLTANDLHVVIGNETITIGKEEFRGLVRERQRFHLLAQMAKAARLAGANTWPEVKAAIEAEELDV